MQRFFPNAGFEFSGLSLSSNRRFDLDGNETTGTGTNPPADLNGDSDYRRHLATVLTRRAVVKAAAV